MQSRCCCPPDSWYAFSFSRSLTSFHSAARFSARSTIAVHVALHPDHARPEGDVVVDRLRERVRLLEHHPDQLADLDRVDAGAVEVLAVVEDRAVDRRARDQVVHAVEAADQRALAAARRPDQGGDAVAADVERDVAHGRIAVVADAHVLAPRRSARRGPAARRRVRGSRRGWSGGRCLGAAAAVCSWDSITCSVGIFTTYVDTCSGARLRRHSSSAAAPAARGSPRRPAA